MYARHPTFGKTDLTMTDLDIPSLLLVDDDETFRTVLGRAMERRGFAVSYADSAESALYLVTHQRVPQYAVVDLKMPGINGLELIERLLALNPTMCIVMLTGFASVATTVEAIKLGAVHYLSKPVDADRLMMAFSRGEAWRHGHVA